ncbi:MaoC family dehydratase [Arthrobacter sp. GCM10027362]|uniref:MaoC family dehydratase n=1 Tax=Arthrobacter sp. GCM10027362 TaxID=3273379 RepID=UPI00362F109A
MEASSSANPVSTVAGMAPIGMTVTFARTVTESDVYLFAGITGDIGPNHTNAQYMAGTRYGQRVAHGALTLGLMSTCSTRLIEMLGDTPTVNYGYDKVRFIRPVFFGDTVTVTYTVEEADEQKLQMRAKVTAVNQHGDLVAAAINVLKVVDQ